MSIVQSLMNRAVPILIAVSFVVLLLGPAEMWTIIRQSGGFPGDRLKFWQLILAGIAQGLNNAVWPFAGAAIVWTLQNRSSEAAE